MSKKHILPEITVPITRTQLIAVVALMRFILSEEAEIVHRSKEMDFQIVWLLNVEICRQWIKKSDSQCEKTTVKLNAAQGLAFMSYWHPADHDGWPFEQQVLRNIIATLDREIIGLRFNSLKKI